MIALAVRAVRLPTAAGSRRPFSVLRRASSTRSRASRCSSCSCRSPASPTHDRGDRARLLHAADPVPQHDDRPARGARGRARGRARHGPHASPDPLAGRAAAGACRRSSPALRDGHGHGHQPRHRGGLRGRRGARRADLRGAPDELQHRVHRRRRAGDRAGAGRRRAAAAACSASSPRGRGQEGADERLRQRLHVHGRQPRPDADQDRRAPRAQRRGDRRRAGDRAAARASGWATSTAARSSPINVANIGRALPEPRGDRDRARHARHRLRQRDGRARGAGGPADPHQRLRRRWTGSTPRWSRRPQGMGMRPWQVLGRSSSRSRCRSIFAGIRTAGGLRRGHRHARRHRRRRRARRHHRQPGQLRAARACSRRRSRSRCWRSPAEGLLGAAPARGHAARAAPAEEISAAGRAAGRACRGGGRRETDRNTHTTRSETE